MAKLAEYDEKSFEEHSENQTLIDAIGCMEALLSFPIHETTSTDNTFDISGYEKSFWGSNKLKAYCKVCVINDHKLEITVPSGTDDLPPYYDVAVGFAFSSEYSSYQTEYGFFILGKTRRIVLSYYWLMEFINAKLEMYRGNEVDVMSTLYDTGAMLSGLTNMNKVLTLLTVQAMVKSLKYEVTAYE